MNSYLSYSFLFFFFNDTATTEIYTLSLHDALPICEGEEDQQERADRQPQVHGGVVRLALVDDQAQRHGGPGLPARDDQRPRSEEHTSELQSRQYLVCRLLLEKKKNITRKKHNSQTK